MLTLYECFAIHALEQADKEVGIASHVGPQICARLPRVALQVGEVKQYLTSLENCAPIALGRIAGTPFRPLRQNVKS
jgi:hypothetical protein